MTWLVKMSSIEDLNIDRKIYYMSKDTHIYPADVAKNLMAMNHKIDFVGSLKNLIKALE
ncbi:hypothetical protein YC2023_084835 [Brassica napus]